MGDEPTWMNSSSGGGGGGGGGRASASHASHRQVSGDVGPPAPYKTPVMAMCLVMNLGLGVCVLFNGLMALGHKSNTDNVGVLFIATYMVIFSSILVAYEMIQICPIQCIDVPFKKNFGFLYGCYGKCAYLLL
jgi:hypothetical protein